MKRHIELDASDKRVSGLVMGVASTFMIQLLIMYVINTNFRFLSMVALLAVSITFNYFINAVFGSVTSFVVFWVHLAFSVIGAFTFNSYHITDRNTLWMFGILGVISLISLFKSDGDVIHRGQVILVIGLSFLTLYIGNTWMTEYGVEIFQKEDQRVQTEYGGYRYAISMIHVFLIAYWYTLPFITPLLSVLSVNERIKEKSKKAEQDALERKARELEDKNLSSFQSQLPLRIEGLLNTWGQLIGKEEKPSIENAPKIRLDLEGQYTYLNGIQDELDQAFHEDFKHSLELIQSNKGNVFYSPVMYWMKQMTNARKITTSTSELMDIIQEEGFEIKEWFKEFQEYTTELRDYYFNRIVKQDALQAFRTVEFGLKGEENLSRELKKFDERFIVLENIRIPSTVGNNKSAESDAIIVSPFGIFTIEAKNYAAEGQYGLHIAKDGKWSKVYRNADGTERYEDENDVNLQSNNHIFAIQNLVNQEIKNQGESIHNYIDVEGIITITNDVVKIHNESDLPIMRTSGLYNHIRKHEQVLSTEQIENIVKILKDNDLPPIRFPIVDFKKEYKEFQEHFAPMEELAIQMQELVGYDDEAKALAIEASEAGDLPFVERDTSTMDATERRK